MYRHCVTDPPPALISPLVTATMEHAHGQGSAPDHHERRFITMDHGGGGGPVPVAASPPNPNIVPLPNLGDFGRFLHAPGLNLHAFLYMFPLYEPRGAPPLRGRPTAAQHAV